MTGRERWDRVEQVLSSDRQVGVMCTGGGSQLIGWLLNHPGASRAMVEARVPYHHAALADCLGAPGPHRVEVCTAIHMAQRAYGRIVDLLEDRQRAVGLGCTAALATRRRRRGEDRAAIATWSEDACAVREVHFDKGTWGRLEQEDLLSEAGLVALQEACRLNPAEPAWPDGLTVRQREMNADDPLAMLYAGDLKVVTALPEGQVTADTARWGRLLLPGSFNPLHKGHAGLMAAAEELCDRPGAYELSVDNVDKPVLPRAKLERRLAQFQGKRPVVITRAATFVAKARLFAECAFAIGYDTAYRLLVPEYYGGPEKMKRAFADMHSAGCLFLVAGRVCGGVYRTLADLDVPESYRGMFRAIPETAFRQDISSTALRAQKQASRSTR